nr:hypothetical protein BaRGS_035099 [Batillaria attramentaria]
MHRDVFGSKGDFITSPEISQMFGEVFTQFPDISKQVSLHLVEISPALSQLQSERLTDKSRPADLTDTGEPAQVQGLGPYRQETSKYGHEISWYRALEDVPKGLSFYLAHEFLDALPIHKFQKTERGWSEVMVDITDDSSPGGVPSLRFVLSPGRTSASTSFLKVGAGDGRDHIEVCPLAGKTVQEVSKRIQEHGGFALFADYGHSGEKGDTFRAFRQHELHDPLVDPGSADITADVDFSYLKQCAEGVSTFGPITQQNFLLNMGIGVRLQMLLQKAKQEHWKSLLTGYDMLTNPNKMGERFKFFAMMNPPFPDYVPAGFVTPDFLKEQR